MFENSYKDVQTLETKLKELLTSDLSNKSKQCAAIIAVTKVVPDPRDPCTATSRGVKLKYCPIGVWVRMDKCRKAPAGQLLEESNVIPESFNSQPWTPTHEVLQQAKLPLPTKHKPVEKMTQKLIFIKASQRTFEREFLGKTFTILC